MDIPWLELNFTNIQNWDEVASLLASGPWSAASAARILSQGEGTVVPADQGGLDVAQLEPLVTPGLRLHETALAEVEQAQAQLAHRKALQVRPLTIGHSR